MALIKTTCAAYWSVLGRRPAITDPTPAAATAFEAEALTAAQILYPLIGV